MKNILILGIGNILRWDDGLGVHIVNHIIDSEREIPENIEIIDGGTAGFDLIPIMEGRDKIIIVDALNANDEPGSIYRFPADHLAGSRMSFSQHDVGMQEVLKMLRVMGELPEIEIIGIVPEDVNTLDIGMSLPVQNAIPKVVEQIFDSAVQ